MLLLSHLELPAILRSELQQPGSHRKHGGGGIAQGGSFNQPHPWTCSGHRRLPWPIPPQPVGWGARDVVGVRGAPASQGSPAEGCPLCLHHCWQTRLLQRSEAARPATLPVLLPQTTCVLCARHHAEGWACTVAGGGMCPCRTSGSEEEAHGHAVKCNDSSHAGQGCPMTRDPGAAAPAWPGCPSIAGSPLARWPMCLVQDPVPSVSQCPQQPRTPCPTALIFEDTVTGESPMNP